MGQKWGLRGDPYLWNELENHFESIHAPLTEDEFHKAVYRAFHILTGERLGQGRIFPCIKI